MNPSSVARSALLPCLLSLFALLSSPLPGVCQYEVEVIFRRGDDAPGTGGQFQDYTRVVSVSTDKKVLFGAIPNSNFQPGYWTWQDDEIRFLTGVGQPVDGIPGSSISGGFRLPTATMSPDGVVTIHAAITGATNTDDTVILKESGNSMQVWHREGDPIDGFSNRFVGDLVGLLPIASSTFDGQVAHVGTVYNDSNRDRDAVLVLGSGVNQEALVAQIGFSADTGPIKMPQLNDVDAEYSGFGSAVINKDRLMVYSAMGSRVKDALAVQGLFMSMDGDASTLVCSGFFPSEVELGPFTIDDGGDIFLANSARSESPFDYQSIHRTNASDTLVLGAPCGIAAKLVSVGDEAPGSDGATFKTIAVPGGPNAVPGFEAAGTGQIALFAELSDGRHGIWLVGHGSMEPVVIENDSVPGFPGAAFYELRNMVAGDGKVAFSAYLDGPSVSHGQGIGPINDNGVWTGSSRADLTRVLQASQFIDVGDGTLGVVEDVFIPSQQGERMSSGSDGRPSPMNDDGDMALYAYMVPAKGVPESVLLLASRGSLIVNSTRDLPDSDDPEGEGQSYVAKDSDGQCDTGFTVVREGGSEEPECTLRAAIFESNVREGHDRITYDIPEAGPWTIQPDGGLPPLLDPVDIIGATFPVVTTKTGRQEEEPAIILDGQGQTDVEAPVQIPAGGQGGVFRNHIIVNWPKSGILVGRAGVSILNNWIGAVQDGAEPGTSGDGIQVQDAPNVTIGGPTEEAGHGPGNLIVGKRIGILATGENATGLRIQGNRLDRNQEAQVRLQGVAGARIGGATLSERNSFDFETTTTGVWITGPTAKDNLIIGNAFVNSGLPAFVQAVRIDGGASSNQIGDATNEKGEPPGNRFAYGYVLLSGESTHSNRIFGNAFGGPRSLIVLEARSNRIGGNTTGLGNHLTSVTVEGASASGNRFEGNIFSAVKEPSGFDLLSISGAPGNVVGGEVEEPGQPPGNVFTGQDFVVGIGIYRLQGIDGDPIRILGNHLGPDLEVGVELFQADSTIVGGETEMARNVIVGNSTGVSIDNSQNVRVQTNYIGLAADGVEVEGNGIGIRMSGTQAVTIGGTRTSLTAGSPPGNFITGNTVGISIGGHSSENTIASNVIGLNVVGAPSAVSLKRGIRIENSKGDVVGGNILTDGNTMSGLGTGILLGPGAVGTRVLGNRIGLALSTFEAQPNTVGVQIVGNRLGGRSFPGRHVIGGTSNVTRNLISFNETGVDISRTEDVDIGANEFAEQSKVAIDIRDSKGIDIVGNLFRDNADDVEATGSNDIHLYSNEGIRHTDVNTGVGLSDSDGILRGNQFSQGAGDAIRLADGSSATITGNNIFDNAGFGVNSDGSSAGSAGGNWWGSPSGPGGVGPGSGDAVSANVDFSDWLTEMVSLVAAARNDTLFVLPGDADSATVFLQNWEDRDDAVSVSVSDELGWITPIDDQIVQLDGDFGGAVRVGFDVPMGTAAGIFDSIGVTAESGANQDDGVETRIVLATYQQALSQIAVLPDTVTLAPGDTVQFQAIGLDQRSRTVDFVPSWTATGGEIDHTGLYIAGNMLGEYLVTASDGTDGISGTGVVIIPSSVGVDNEDYGADEVPTEFRLYQSYPNPFNPVTRIPFDVKEASKVTLKVYDVIGREVVTLVDEPLPAGRYEQTFNGRNLPSGMYLYVIQMGSFRRARKMMLLK